MENAEYEKMDILQRDNWWYRGRRFVVRALVKKYFPDWGSFLDVGCGTGEGVHIIGDRGVLSGIDMSDTALGIARKNGYQRLIRGSGEMLPFASEEFDGIMILDVLEHIVDDTRALLECNRVLTPGGHMVVTVPAYQWLWSGHDEVFGHQRRYYQKKLKILLHHAGFRIVFSSYLFFFTFPIVVIFRMLERFFRNKKKSHFFATPKIANWVLRGVIYMEGFLMKYGARLPWGSSIIMVCAKKRN